MLRWNQAEILRIGSALYRPANFASYLVSPWLWSWILRTNQNVLVLQVFPAFVLVASEVDWHFEFNILKNMCQLQGVLRHLILSPEATPTSRLMPVCLALFISWCFPITWFLGGGGVLNFSATSLLSVEYVQSVLLKKGIEKWNMKFVR